MEAHFKHLITISFNYDFELLEPLHQLGDRLTYILDQSGIGFYEGHEMSKDADGEGQIYILASNAEKVYKLIEPVLFKVDWMNGAMVQLQFKKHSGLTKSIEFMLEKV
ncbi:MAG: hypothetical protein KDC53_07145 [Saprospiraceae bacterium]|nr:hypothetical protein [Saprospiraceae bacterium]